MTTTAAERWCPNCEQVYRATIIREREGGELSSDVSECPDCETPGQLLVDVET